MWRRSLLVGFLLLAGCPKDSDDDYQMPPLPQYDPNAPPPPRNLASPPLTKYEQAGPVVPTAPPAALAPTSAGTTPATAPASAPARPPAPASAPKRK